MLDKIKLKKLTLVVTALILLLGVGGFWVKKQPPPVAPAFSYHNLIRFHVIANSDSAADQALKLKVRDRILDDLQPIISQAVSVEQARLLVSENLQQIQAAAREEIIQNGMDYPIQAELGQFEFPAKIYGDVVLPNGSYEALRVSIGQGAGQNWWCVLFPPLCFVNGSGGPALGNSQWFEDLELTSPVMAPLPEEPQSVSVSGEEPVSNPQPQIRFRLLNLLHK